jgi:hypothetical protein
MSIIPFKYLIQNIKEFLLNDNPTKNQRKDEELEFLQFGIFSMQTQSPRKEELFFG